MRTEAELGEAVASQETLVATNQELGRKLTEATDTPVASEASLRKREEVEGGRKNI